MLQARSHYLLRRAHMSIPAVKMRVAGPALYDRLKARLLTTGPAAEYAAWRGKRKLRADPLQANLFRQVHGALDLPVLPARRTVRGTVWAVSVVRNEADIIAPVIEHLFRQGVDAVLIADNESTDRTPFLLADLAKRHPVHVAVDGEKGHYQALKMTILADLARKAGADWIVPFDADEFWFAPEGTLGDFLRTSKFKRMRVEMHNLYPLPGVRFGQGPWRLDRQPCEFQKVAFRSHRHAVLADGNHDILRPGRWSTGPRIVHVPWRSEEQFRRKALDGAKALAMTTLDADVGWHWRNLAALTDQAAEQVWEKIEQGEAVTGIAWSPGALAQIVDPLKWGSWDPEGILEADTQS